MEWKRTVNFSKSKNKGVDHFIYRRLPPPDSTCFSLWTETGNGLQVKKRNEKSSLEVLQ